MNIRYPSGARVKFFSAFSLKIFSWVLKTTILIISSGAHVASDCFSCEFMRLQISRFKRLLKIINLFSNTYHREIPSMQKQLRKRRK